MTRYGATIQDAEGLRLTAEEIALFRDTNPFGFILFARNIDTPDQVKALCSDFREAVGRDAIITVDQEGGRVQRLRQPQWRQWTPPLEFVERAGPDANRAMYLRYRLIAHELRTVGIDSNCAPMVDVTVSGTHEFLRNRCYGNDPHTIADLGRAVADGLLAGGVLPIVKHMPGHGRSTQDSHFDLPHVHADVAELKACDFAPFKALNDLPMGMTSHLVYDAIDDAPATLSAEVLKVIRDDIGFGGLVMTDDVSMKALSGSLTEIARTSIAAGVDVILHCNGTLAARAEVASAAGEMTDAAQRRAEAALAARKQPDVLDIANSEAQLEALLHGQVYG